MLDGQLERTAIGAGKLVRLALTSAAPARSDRMNDVPGRQIAGRGDHGRAGRAAVGISLASLFDDRRAAPSMDRAVDAPAAGQMRVGGVNDGVDFLLGNVARLQLDHRLADRPAHGAPPYVNEPHEFYQERRALLIPLSASGEGWEIETKKPRLPS